MSAAALGGPWPIFRLVKLAGGHRHGGVACVFVCYLDDSDDKDSSVATLAGYVAPEAAWERFEEEAAPIFDRYEVPILHAKELHGTKECFAGWSRIKKQTFIIEFYGVAAQFVSFGVSVLARKTAISDWKKEYPRNSGMSPYGVCFTSVMHTAVYNNPLAHEIRDEGVSFLVEAGNKNNPEILKRFHKHSKHEMYRGKVRSLDFVLKDSCRAIQIADFLAFHSRRREAQSDRTDGKLWLPPDKLYMEAMKRLPHDVTTFRSDFRKLTNEEAMNPSLIKG